MGRSFRLTVLRCTTRKFAGIDFARFHSTRGNLNVIAQLTPAIQVKQKLFLENKEKK